MIQRIQTLYLLLAFACMGLLLIFPFGEITLKSQETIKLGIQGFDYIKNGNSEHFTILPLTIMISISMLITFISIFLFKKRMLQIRFNVFNFIFQIGSIGLMLFYLFQAKGLAGKSWNTKITIITPLIAAIFTYLAIRAIGKDEALVRSISRIR